MATSMNKVHFERVRESFRNGNTTFPEDALRGLFAYIEEVGGGKAPEYPEAPDTSGGPVPGAAKVATTKTDEPEDEGAYAGMTKEDLVEEARSRDLAVSGTKAEIIERLEADDAAGDEPEEDDDGGS